jgi:sterol desaturase/sphingolipid hydroxylase (fatty acid hydroxylase superfamily)
LFFPSVGCKPAKAASDIPQTTIAACYGQKLKHPLIWINALRAGGDLYSWCRTHNERAFGMGLNAQSYVPSDWALDDPVCAREQRDGVLQGECVLLSNLQPLAGPWHLMSIGDQYSLESFFRLWGSVVFFCLLLHIAERIRPAEQNQSYRSMVTNGTITLAYATLSPVSLFGANYVAGYFVATLVNRLSRPSFVIDLNNLTSAYSSLATIALLVPIALLPLVVYDFFYYWFHRLQHANSWLWEQHKLHHSDQALNVTTSYRLNWLEDFFKSLLVTIPVALILGLQPFQPFQVGIVASVTGIVTQIWGQFLHLNIRLSYGFLSGFITGPQYHRFSPQECSNFFRHAGYART